MRLPVQIGNSVAVSRPAGQLNGRRVLHGEQIRDELPHHLMGADLLGGDVLGFAQCGDCLAGVAAPGVGSGDLEQPADGRYKDDPAITRAGR